MQRNTVIKTMLAVMLFTIPASVLAYNDTETYDLTFPEALEYAEDRQFFNEGGNLDPDKEVTRGEVIRILLDNDGIIPDENSELEGVSTENAPYFERMKKLGVLFFHSINPEVRETEPYALWRTLSVAMKYEGVPVPRTFDASSFRSVFPQQSAEAFYAPTLFRAYQLGIINPDRQNVHPFRNTTRIDLLVTLYQLEVYQQRVEQSLSNPNSIELTNKPASNQTSINHPLIRNDKFPILLDVWNKATTSYLNEATVDEDDLVYGAIEGLVDKLDDPYTLFQEPELAEVFENSLSNEIQGIGASLALNEDDEVVVVSPLNDSPAEKAGVLPGDIIRKVDDIEINNLTLIEVVRLIQGPAGTAVELTVDRNGLLKDIAIVRARISVPSVEAEVTNDNILIVTINNFGLGTANSFGDFVAQVEPDDLSGIVIDVRNNPGGFLSSAIEIADYFVDSGDLITRLKGPRISESEFANSQPLLKGVPAYVLINSGTASASEILAAALADHELATLIGTKSFGKGTVQEISSYADSSSLKLTVAKWLTPKGKSINGIGIAPDIEVITTNADRAAKVDPQLNRALREIRL